MIKFDFFLFGISLDVTDSIIIAPRYLKRQGSRPKSRRTNVVTVHVEREEKRSIKCEESEVIGIQLFS